VSAPVVTALCTGIVGIIGAIGALAALFVHSKNHPGA